MMKRTFLFVFLLIFSFLFFLRAEAEGGIFFGLQGGYSAQKPSLKDVEFNTDTTFLYGVRAGVKFLMIAAEVNYFQAAHNLSVQEFPHIGWNDRQVDYSYLGANLRFYFPILIIQPYFTFGYGYYSANIKNIDEDRKKGFNLGVGVELTLGKKISLLAEGKYHRAKLDIQQEELTIGDFTLSGGLNINF